MVKRLIAEIIFLLFLYALCRIVFLVIQNDVLELHSALQITRILLGGIRFDLSAIAATNAIYFILLLLPFSFQENKAFKHTTFILFIIINAICLLFNISDIAYFSFINKRSQADMLQFITGEKGNDLLRLMPTFLIEYWYLALLYVLIIVSLIAFQKNSIKNYKHPKTSVKYYVQSFFVFVAFAGLIVLAIRGGIQTKPLNLIHASEMTEVKNIPAIINTPFSIIKSFGKRNLVEKHYFPEEALEPLKKGIIKQEENRPFSRENVVVIIVESLSKNYLSYFGGNAATPFLDSIFRQSIVFTNAFANGKESIQGIPAILSSIPSWQNDPFIFSSYASNKISSLANILKEKGYKTQFFHGGVNGTMGFDSYTKLAGFDQYFGRSEYNNENDFDGKWGIWDEPFLQFMAQELSKTTPPFFSTVFTLNTHHPFSIPEKYKNRFCKKTDPILNCVEYLDFSLSRFFDSIKKNQWFQNTLFIITADHAAPSALNKYNSPIEEYRIPIAFYKPGDKDFRGTNTAIANQTDILPSVLSLLHYPEPYFTFGKNLFELSKYRFAITYNADTYQLIDSQYYYQFNGEKGIGFYNWKTDNTLKYNLYKGNPEGPIFTCDSTLKMMIQFFNHCMINNQMHREMIKQNP